MTSPRSRSPSPSRDESRPKKQKTSGFKWKEKRPKDPDQAGESRDSGRLERGYRNRSPRRDSYRERDRERDDYDRRDRDRDRHNGNEQRDRDSNLTRKPKSEHHSNPPSANTHPPPSDKLPSSTSNIAVKAAKKEKPKRPPPSTEPMIIVNINDRLGTKAAIPCLASDSIKAFKAVVAAHIGRQPHEIMLKRQGERPFKDVLTLADYGVSNGVQLDLELDTGD